MKDRPKLKRCVSALQNIREIAKSCAWQLTGLAVSIDKFSFEGRRHCLKESAGFAMLSKRAGSSGRTF